MLQRDQLRCLLRIKSFSACSIYTPRCSFQKTKGVWFRFLKSRTTQNEGDFVKMLLFCSLFLFNLSFARTSSEQQKYFQIQKVQVREVPVSRSTLIEVHSLIDIKPLPVPIPPMLPVPPSPGLAGAGEIINIGLKIWKIIEQNKPVVNLNLNRASALPFELKSWTDMEKWSDIQVREYEIVYINGFKKEVIKMDVLLTYSYGGQYNQVGEYLSQVGVLIKNLEVSWGFTVNAETEVARVVNVGTTQNPMALMEMNFKWTVSSVVKYIQESLHFNIKGNGEVIAY
jgi:hypothetical protein